ncbi:MAG: D-alanyl-D-alanine carboxypeptidase [Lachnospiraceae bacterium]|nr:D-alanyl-D-alanine carboxypeptidase [Lachnospiraceae bacterium]
MYFKRKKGFLTFSLLTVFIISFFFNCYTLTAHATLEELAADAEARKLLPIQSNEIDNWPVGPEIGAQAAILMDANTGIILYAKNINEKLYPASTTKILTCLLAMENGNLDDMVSFSREAVFSVPYDGSNMGMDVGESITLEECLYGILVGSANEVANATAEHIGGSIDNFVEMMNARAAELGCTNSHFANTNGLFDENHYTSAHDLALISAAFFQNEMLCKISNTARYHFEATATQPDDFYLITKHRLVNGEIPYEGIVGGKTGYTDISRQTLVSCAEQNGMKLICVILKEESPAQFTDTVELFNYGFQNFQVLNIAENEDKFNMDNTNFFKADYDIFGNSEPILSIDTSSYVIVPNMADFSALESTINYDISSENSNVQSDESRIAKITYTYNGAYVGETYVNLSDYAKNSYSFSAESPATTDTTVSRVETPSPAESENTIFINVKKVLIGILIFATIIICLFILRAIIIHRDNELRRQNRLKRKKYRRERISSGFDDFDF